MLVWSILPGVASAEIYKYVDKNGRVVYTDDPWSVPEEVRRKVVQRDKQLANKSPLTQEVRPEGQDRTMEQEKKPVANMGRLTEVFSNTQASNRVSGYAWVKPIIIGVTFIVLFLAIGKISRAMGHRQIGSLLLVVLTLAVLASFLYSYLDFINKAYTEIKTGVLGTKEQVNKRDEMMNEITKQEPKEEKR
jgi:hypothetical protein